MTDPDAAAPPRKLVVVATAVALALAVIVAIIGITSSGGDPETPQAPGRLALPAVDAPDSDSATCRELVDQLPDTLPSRGRMLPRRELADPAPEAAAAWGEAEPIVLRCGIGKPAELKKTSKLRVINDVQWLPTEGQGSVTWYAVDRKAYVALTITGDQGTGPLQEISNTIAQAMTAVAPSP